MNISVNIFSKRRGAPSQDVTLERILGDCAKIADAFKGLGPLPLRLEVSQEKFDQLRRAIEHEILTDVPKFGVVPYADPPGPVDVRIIPGAPSDLWRVVYRCPDCGPGVSLAIERPFRCPTCHGTHEVY